MTRVRWQLAIAAAGMVITLVYALYELIVRVGLW
jgi:hypothetical protein